jgi:hypothetical protein
MKAIDYDLEMSDARFERMLLDYPELLRRFREMDREKEQIEKGTALFLKMMDSIKVRP